MQLASSETRLPNAFFPIPLDNPQTPHTPFPHPRSPIDIQPTTQVGRQAAAEKRPYSISSSLLITILRLLPAGIPPSAPLLLDVANPPMSGNPSSSDDTATGVGENSTGT